MHLQMIFVALVCLMTACAADNPLDHRSRSNLKSLAAEEACMFVRSGELVEQGTARFDRWQGVGGVQIGEGGVCSGALIRPNVVLTADHCVRASEPVNRVMGPVLPASQFQFSLSSPFFADEAVAEDTRQVIEVVTIDDTETFFDAALLILDEPYPESVPVYRLHNAEVAAATNLLAAVGFGGYTDGTDVNSYDIGRRRYGQVRFSGYERDFDFGWPNVVDYLAVVPGGQDDTMICQGDSGSSLFLEDNADSYIVGVTSLGGAADQTDFRTRCATSTEGFFVPADVILPWTNQKLRARGFEVKPVGRHVVRGRIVDVTNDIVTLAVAKYIDNPSGLSAQSLELEDCGDQCGLASVLVSRSPERDVVVEFEQSSGRSHIIDVQPADFGGRAQRAIVVRVFEDPTPPRQDATGREIQDVTLEMVDYLPEDGSIALADVGRRFMANLCNAGCAEKTVSEVEITSTAADQMFVAHVEAIRGQGLFLRQLIPFTQDSAEDDSENTDSCATEPAQ